MAAPTVYANVAKGAGVEGELFAGIKFWVAQRVPSRNHYLEKIRSNGGAVVLLEKNADHLIADENLRIHCPPGSISYKFIDKCIEEGEVVDARQYPAGPSTDSARAVGSNSRPTKSGRAAYTAEEDRILYNWVRDSEKRGGTSSGNEIYKQLEQKHPRHTWQSWRDRYIKKLRDQPPSGLNVPENAPPSPTSDQSAEHLAAPAPRSAPAITAKPTKQPAKLATQPVKRSEPRRSGGKGEPKSTETYTVDDFEKLFGKEDWEELYANVEEILEAPAKTYIEAWANWAKGTSQTADQWRQYFEKVVHPQYRRDEPWKKASIKKRVRQRHETERSSQVETEQSSQVEAEQRSQVKPEVEASKATGDNEGEGKEEEPLVDQVEPKQVASPPVEPFEELEVEIAEFASMMVPSTPKRKRESKAHTQPDTTAEEDQLLEEFLKARLGNVPTSAYSFWANGRLGFLGSNGAVESTEVRLMLGRQWNLLSDEEKAPYFVMEAADRRRAELQKMQSSDQDSSTVLGETPKFIVETHERMMKRIQDGDLDEFANEASSSRPPKRLKQEHPPNEPESEEAVEDAFLGTQYQPVEISSGSSIYESEQDEKEEEEGQEQDMEDLVQAELQTQDFGDEDADESDKPAPTTEAEEFPDLGSPTPTSDHDELSFDASTPKPPIKKPTAFDTQAILSSPSQGYRIGALPRPATRASAQDTIRSPSPLEAASSHSVASTTHSIREFRRSLYDEEIDDPHPTSFPISQALAPLPRPKKHSPPPASDISSPDSMDSNFDPDPPLNSNTDITRFFTELGAEGFSEEEIRTALRHTRLRPELAAEVLDAWKDLKPLPDKRGIWSKEEDDQVFSGDGVVLAMLHRKHTTDGWGGIEERMRFLERWKEMGGDEDEDEEG